MPMYESPGWNKTREKKAIAQMKRWNKVLTRKSKLAIAASRRGAWTSMFRNFAYAVEMYGAIRDVYGESPYGPDEGHSIPEILASAEEGMRMLETALAYSLDGRG